MPPSEVKKTLFDKILVLDFETYWCSKTYTIRKLTTEEYVRDTRFLSHGAAFHWFGEGGEPVYLRHAELVLFLAVVDWSRTAVMAHNAMFDVAILHWRYGYMPAFIIDTLSMARALRGAEGGNSLEKLAQDFGLPPKGKALHSTNGLRVLSDEVHEELASYCEHDVWLCEETFKRLSTNFPKSELKVIDLTLKMFLDPALVLDASILDEAIIAEEKARYALLQRLGVLEAELASNEKFAALLRLYGLEPPTKISKTTKKVAYAFAKNDAEFQAVMACGNEDVELLCEARLKVKSTLERTRAQRFRSIATRGTLPVPLHYYGGHTGRWSAAKGAGLNLQNLKRGSFLRKAIKAPPGYSLVVGDLSQIEVRVLAQLSDNQNLINIFESGEDVYAVFGQEMFGVPGMTKDSHPVLRQSAKSGLLGCFGADTKALTNRGWKDIVSVLDTDLLWDGEDWVKHEGVICQGLKQTYRFQSVSATKDHEILTEHGWREWSEVHTKHSLFQSALRTANLPSSTGEERSYMRAQAPNTSPTFAAPVAGKASLLDRVSLEGDLLGAIHAQRNNLRKQECTIFSTPQSCRMRSIGTDCSTESARQYPDATTLVQKPTKTTAVEVFPYSSNGAKTAQISCGTSLRCLDGITQAYKWTVSITIKDTSRETCVLLQEAKTQQTSVSTAPEKLSASKNVSQSSKEELTYDVLNCGPRNRFTVLTDSGPIIVHNCGFMLGFVSFASQLLVGFLGAPPIRYGVAEAKQLGVTAKDVERFISYAPFMERVLAIPRTCTDDEIVVHALASKKIVDKYRASSEPVTQFWDLMGWLIGHSLIEGNEYRVGCLTFGKEYIELPNKMRLRYPDIRVAMDERGRPQYTYQSGRKRKKLYPGSITENVVQALARIVMSDAMVRIAKKFKVLLTVHDELVMLVPDAQLAYAVPWIKEQMIAEPWFLPGIPLNASVESAKSYGDAK